MSYLVIARKFRPQTFESIAGQDHISRALANAILRNRVPHALLFTGPRGVGKTTSARVLARALNCTGRDLPSAEQLEAGVDARHAVEPCGSCVNCIEIARSSSLSVWEIDGASNNSVDNVRDLIDSLRSLPPPGSNYKIYIIDEVHMLSIAAFNALLKSLEEPPPNTVFIFATTEPHKIPETVISRCQRHDFRRLAQSVISDQLIDIAAKEGVELEPSVAHFIARRAQGGMRDAQSMLDRLIASGTGSLGLPDAYAVFGVVDEGFFFEQSAAVLNGDLAVCYAQLDEVFKQSIDLRSFVADFLSHWRNVMLLATSMDTERRQKIDTSLLSRLLTLPPAEVERISEQITGTSAFTILRLFDIAEQAAEQALRSSFPRYVLEAGLAKMVSMEDLKPLREVLQHLSGALEGSVQTGGGSPTAEKSRTLAKSAASVTTRSTSPRPQTAEATVEPFDSDAVSADFNPSWNAFLAHVKNSKAVRLEAYLRRVSPKVFTSGMLIIEGSAFDIDSIKDSSILSVLRTLLGEYSGSEKWEIQFKEHRIATEETTDAGRKRAHVPGSLAAQEEDASRERRTRLEQEARQQEAVKDALTIFEGSAIEKVNILEP